MFRITLGFAAIILLISCAANASAPVSSGSINGEWSGVFSISGHTAEVTLTFDVDGKKLTGTVFSEHTGPGNITDGTFENNKLTCTLKFEKHESIVFRGELADDKLSGTFDTEGMTGTWVASRKK